jgi:cholesterol oxidase
VADFDAVIVGSGFGGAVTACRLAEHGYRVLVLERGRRWTPETYPRRPGDAWLWDDRRPEQRNGWIDLRMFPQMMVAQGAGVGGGSLIYANISIDAEEEIFQDGWPPEITFEELKPYYAEVGRMLGVGKIPANQISQRTRLMREAAEAIGHGDRFKQIDLAVTFDPDWNYDLDQPFDVRHSKTWTNEHGREQGTCIHIGNCDIGCDVLAKNTLDLNYLARAENLGAEVRPLHQVTHVEPEPSGTPDRGYRVHFRRIEQGRTQPGSVTGRLVILAAGSLGSTELLLRSRDEYRTLNAVSPTLGRGWCSNGDFLTPAIHRGRDVSPTRGPTISSAIDFLDGSQGGHEFFIEDGGFPDVLGNAIDAAARGGNLVHRSLREVVRQRVQGRDPMRSLMPWFAQGRDYQDGVFRLRKQWFGLFGPRRLRLDWDIRRSEGLIDAIAEMHMRLAGATGGEPIVSPAWTKARWLVTPHPLGGCNMAEDSARGVVNHMGEVFGYPNLFVADGAIVPEAIGANPSKTIAALAERIAGEIVEQHR